MPIYEASERVLRAFQDELMTAESLSEFCDVVGQYMRTANVLAQFKKYCFFFFPPHACLFVFFLAGLLSEIPNPDVFLQDLLNSLP